MRIFNTLIATTVALVLSLNVAAQNIDKFQQKPYYSNYGYTETIIDRPVEKVWPHVLEIAKWMDAHNLETISGEPGKFGHLVKVMPHGLTDKNPLPHYHLYAVAKIIPFKLIALEVFPEKNGSYGGDDKHTSFDTVLLSDIGGKKTKVAFYLTDINWKENPKNGMDPDKRDAGMQSYMDNKFEQFWVNLKNNVENSDDEVTSLSREVTSKGNDR